MAKIYLNGDVGYKIASNNTKVFGSSGTDSIILLAGVTGVDLDSNVDTVELASNIGGYTFSQVGIGMEVYQSGVLVTTFDSPNMNPVFADGAVDIQYSGGIMSLGGTTFVNGASPVTAVSGGSAANSITISGGGSSDAQSANITFDILSSGVYTHTINNFASGDILKFVDNNISITNTDLSDGQVTLKWNDGTSTNDSTIIISGISSTDDASLSSIGDFNTVFGAGTIPNVTSSASTSISITANTTAVAGVAENFTYAIDSSTGSVVSQLSADVTLSGFTVGEDSLTFVDVASGTTSTASFVNDVIVSSSAINSQTDVVFDANTSGNSYQLVLTGVVDSTLSTVNMTVA
jgi:hypothetical protein